MHADSCILFVAVHLAALHDSAREYFQSAVRKALVRDINNTDLGAMVIVFLVCL